MKYIYNDLEAIADRIMTGNRKIVVYGAGMIGRVLVPYLIEEYGLFDNLLFFVDADVRKQRETISIGDREYRIVSQEVLKQFPDNAVLWITNSNYQPIVELLDGIEKLKQAEGYILPVLQVLATRNLGKRENIRISEEPMIPKKIHYCWFSGKPIPDYLKRCMESWNRFCPDYEIIRWDESNYDITWNSYMQQAYEAEKWGFVPDIARLDILYRHGGIYLDTDVELVRNLDELLYQSAFAGVEKWGNVNLGGCCGVMPQHPMIKEILEYRINEKFILKDGGMNLTTCGFYETKPLINRGMKPNNTTQRVADMTIYSSDYFHPYDYMSGETLLTDNTFSIHHFNGGWLDESKMAERKRTKMMYQLMLDRMRENSE